MWQELVEKRSEKGRVVVMHAEENRLDRRQGISTILMGVTEKSAEEAASIVM